MSQSPENVRHFISTEGLVKRYGKREVVRGVDLKVFAGEIVGSIGSGLCLLVGVAPDAQWTGTSGIGTDGTNAGLAEGYAFADDNGVSVHNNSWGLAFLGLLDKTVTDAIQDAANNGRDGRGMVIVFASGNSDLAAGNSDILCAGHDL